MLSNGRQITYYIMPELNPQFAQFEKEVEAMLVELISKLEKGNFTQTQLSQIAAQLNSLDELKKLGFDQSVEKYFANYEVIYADIIKKAKGVNLTGINTDLLERIQTLDKEYLLGKASSWGKQFDSSFAKSVLRGDTINQTVVNLNEIPLTDTQMKTVLNTSYSDFNRSVTKEIYKDVPEQRFRYAGGVIPTSSDQCAWLSNNQNPKGYTAAEIDAGIDTPFGVITWSGRQPNYNCGHTWEPIITELI